MTFCFLQKLQNTEYVKVSMVTLRMLFLDMTLYNWVIGWGQRVASKRQDPITQGRSVTPQENWYFNNTAVRTSEFV